MTSRDALNEQNLSTSLFAFESISTVFAAAVFSMLFFLAFAYPARAQTETVLHRFKVNGKDGVDPYAGVILYSGNLYGTTWLGGANGGGTVFKVTPSGTESVLHSFSNTCCVDGGQPAASLAVDAEGNLYGTTEVGGSVGVGTVFKLTPSGAETILYNFDGQDGGYPEAGVVLDSQGNLYGTTESGGSSGDGTVFKLTPSGVLSILHSFSGGTKDGAVPAGGVVFDSQGNLYGTTFNGGASGVGTVFKLTPTGSETILHSFKANGKDGFGPSAGIVLYSGSLYGTTYRGGTIGVGAVFKVTLSGEETILHSFTGGMDGISPYAGLVVDTNGNLYGTTQYGGSFDFGTVFELTPSGVETVLHSFSNNGTDGNTPQAGLAIDESGNLYGTTFYGGSTTLFDGGEGGGVVFKIVP
jgi:uncharacterized repeat protein (TIGR03803 family)